MLIFVAFRGKANNNYGILGHNHSTLQITIPSRRHSTDLHYRIIAFTFIIIVVIGFIIVVDMVPEMLKSSTVRFTFKVLLGETDEEVFLFFFEVGVAIFLSVKFGFKVLDSGVEKRNLNEIE